MISKAVIATTVVAGAVTFLVESQTVLIAQDGIPAQQRAPRSPYMGPAPAPSPVERVGPNQVRIGKILIDTAKKELSVAGVVNDVNVLEFLANTKGGWKAYESALELETNAVNFNVACLLIGLDPVGAVIAKRQFDPDPPQGVPVDVFIEWDEGGRTRRIRAEQFLYNRMTKQTLSEGPWVYTGSVIYEVNRYLAETEGTLVGFMHTPSPILENPRLMTEIGSYGDHIINPKLNLKPGAAVTMVVHAIPRPITKK